MDESISLEARQRAFNQILEIYVLPEIKNRRDEGKIKGQYILTAAQVLLSGDGQKAKVRLNDEAKIMSKVKLKEGAKAKKGDAVLMKDIEEVGFFQLPDDEEPDFGHISMIRLADYWYFGFDARYNKGQARKHLEVAKQFYDIAVIAFEKELWSAFIDNLFSSVELLAKSELLLMPDEKFARKTNHKTIKSRYNNFVKIGNAKSEYAKALNHLSQLREKARYLKSEFVIDRIDAKDLLKISQDMISYVEPRLQKSLIR